MCGRFTIDTPPELLTELFGLAEPPSIPPCYNVAPTHLIPVIRQYVDGENHLDSLRWGLISSWSKEKSISNLMINARSETVSEKPAFKQSVRYRRCVVAASGYYEWLTEGKKPWYIRLKDGSPMVFAGLWDTWKSPEGEAVDSCTILTTASNGLIEPLHDRMPVVLDQDGCRVWLDRNTKNPVEITHLLQPYPADMMDMYAVSSQVNSVKNDFADLVLPVDGNAEYKGTGDPQ